MTRRGRPAHPDILTPAEWGVLDGVRDGLSNAEIADRLGVSVNTVRYHVSNMLTKVGVPDRQALAAWEGAPAVEVRRHHGLLALARIVGLAAALLVGAVLVWVALDRLSGTSAEVPASPPQATATVEGEATVDPLGPDVPFASDGRFWARALMSPSTSTGPPNVAVAKDGSIVVGMTVSYFERVPGDYTLDVGDGPIAGAGSWDAVLVKYDSAGTHVWTRLLAGPGDEGISDIVVAEDGAILVSGWYGDAADLGRGPEPATDKRDMFIARYLSDGSLDWLRTYGSRGRDGGGGVALFSDGSIVWSGSFGSAGTVGAPGIDTGDPYSDFIARLSPGGDPEWARPIERVSVFAVDRSTERIVYAYNDVLEVNPPTTPRYGVAALSGDGQPLWDLPFSGSGNASVRDVELLPDGSAVAVGSFGDPTDFGGGVFEPSGCCSPYTNENMVRDSFVLRIGPSGEHAWSQRWGGNLLDDASTVTREASGTLLVGGTFTGLFEIPGIATSIRPSFPNGEFTGHEMHSGYVARLAEDGEILALVNLAQAGRIDYLAPIIVDSAATKDGEMLVGGRYFTSATFPFGGRIANSEWLDYFIARVEAP